MESIRIILLSIMIIGIGMTMFNQTKSAVSNTSLESQMIETFNSQFETYFGDEVTGSHVRFLISAVKSNNSNSTRYHNISINYAGTLNESAISSSAIYKVKAGKDVNGTDGYDSTGYLINIYIYQ